MQMRRWSWVMVLLLVVLLPLVLFAAEGGEQSEVGNTIDWLWAMAWKAVGVVLAGFVLKLLTKHCINLHHLRGLNVGEGCVIPTPTFMRVNYDGNPFRTTVM